MYLQQVIGTKKLEKILFFVCIYKPLKKKSRIRNPVYGSEDSDLDLYQNATDPEQ